MNYQIDINIKEAIDVWIEYGIDPGSCTRLLLKGEYNEAFKHAHPLIKPHWDDHIAYIETLPKECRGQNMETWKKLKKENNS